MNEPKVGSHSPWGTIDNITRIAAGVLFVGTPSHGGIWLSDQRIAQIPETLRKPKSAYAEKPRWWEQDLEAGFPLWFFGGLYHRERHRRVEREQLVKMLDYFGADWIKALKETRVTPLCSHCRSEDVSVDASARWDDEAQNYVLSGTYDNTDCHHCDGETHTFDVPSVAPILVVPNDDEAAGAPLGFKERLPGEEGNEPYVVAA